MLTDRADAALELLKLRRRDSAGLSWNRSAMSRVLDRTELGQGPEDLELAGAHRDRHSALDGAPCLDDVSHDLLVGSTARLQRLSLLNQALYIGGGGRAIHRGRSAAVALWTTGVPVEPPVVEIVVAEEPPQPATREAAMTTGAMRLLPRIRRFM